MGKKVKFTKEWREAAMKKEGTKAYGESFFSDDKAERLEELSTFKPLHDWVLVKKNFSAGAFTAGGIIKPGATMSRSGNLVNKEERPTYGWVLNIGDKVKDVKVGDYIHFPYAAGTTFDLDGETLSVIKEIDIHAIVTD
jgi:co-chaperonin GroES (HSP10)